MDKIPATLIRKLTPDGKLWGSWKGYSLSLSSDFSAILAPKGTQIIWSNGNQELPRDTLTLFWPRETYTCNAMYNDDKSLYGVYCDIIQPPAIRHDRIVCYYEGITLFINPDFTYEIFDDRVQGDELERDNENPTLRIIRQSVIDRTGFIKAIPSRLPDLNKYAQ